MVLGIKLSILSSNQYPPVVNSYEFCYMEVSDEACIRLRNEYLSDNNSYHHLNLAMFSLTVKPPGSDSLLGISGWAILKLIENTCVSIARF